MIGHVKAFDASAKRIDHVTLNGLRLRRVGEANDVEGWVTVWDAEAKNYVRLEGVVVFVMRKEGEPDQPLRVP